MRPMSMIPSAARKSNRLRSGSPRMPRRSPPPGCLHSTVTEVLLKHHSNGQVAGGTEDGGCLPPTIPALHHPSLGVLGLETKIERETKSGCNLVPPTEHHTALQGRRWKFAASQLLARHLHYRSHVPRQSPTVAMSRRCLGKDSALQSVSSYHANPTICPNAVGVLRG